jgi:hypothetical protein
VVATDVAVVYDAADTAAHVQPLAGDLVAGGPSPLASFACGEILAAVLTDQAFYVYDALLDVWQVQAYDFPPDYAYFSGMIMGADHTAAVLGRDGGAPSLNLAYSGVTHGFAHREDGANRVQGHSELDHGFAGFVGEGDTITGLLGYSALTGSFRFEAQPAGVEYGSAPDVDRARREACTVWAAAGNQNRGRIAQREHLWVYDTLTGLWTHETVDYDYPAVDHHGPWTGGRLATTFLYASGDDDALEARTVWSPGGLDVMDLQMRPSSLVSVLVGGQVVGLQARDNPQDPARWWLASRDHPAGLELQATRRWSADLIAGDRWLQWTAYDGESDQVDLFFYHGPGNSVQSVTVRDGTYATSLAGTHVQCVTARDGGVDVVFYSALLDQLAIRTMPDAYAYTRFSDDLALCYASGVADFLFDAETGEVHARGLAYDPDTAVADEVAVGVDPAAGTAEAYSGITHAWSTVDLGGDAEATAGALVAGAWRTDRSRYAAFDAVGGGWTELVPTDAYRAEVGERTMVVRDSDRVWAYTPLDATPVADRHAAGESEPAADLARAAAGVRCHPNPFNGRAVIEGTVPVATRVTVDVTDLRGRRIAVLVDAERPAGPLVVPWDTRRLASGVYLVRVRIGGATAVRKVTLAR